MTSDKKIPVRCTSVFYNATGYTNDVRDIILRLNENKFLVKIHPLDDRRGIPGVLTAETKQKLDKLAQRADQPDSINLIWLPALHLARNPNSAVHIGRTMFETDRIPPDWAEKCNQMDEIWVPSQFNVETFASAGVNRDKIFIIPSSLDPSNYLSDINPADLSAKTGFNFLSVFGWGYRKGWDVLVRAYITEFNKNDNVALILKVNVPGFTTLEKIKRQMFEYIISLGFSAANLPEIFLINQ